MENTDGALNSLESSYSSVSRADAPGDAFALSVPVLVVGAGAAGARTAIELRQNGVTPLVIGKRSHGDAHTTWARGGINASLGNLDSEDNWKIHAADTLEEGHLLNDPKSVEAVTKNMPARMRELDDWGMEFTRTESGEISQRYFGAQSYRRTCFAGDHTGESLLDTLVEKAQSLNIPYLDEIYISELIETDGEVHGAVGVTLDTNREIVFYADEVVLAAGGATAVYGRHSSRDDENTADGVALATRAGAVATDMEFVQFHPTGMVGYGEEWDGRLVTEAVRGEGGRLYNADGERFMERYSPEQMELDARDVVARAIWREVREGRGTDSGGVLLDISHRDRDFIKERLPRMYERFQSLGVDMATDPVTVAPTAHYTMGGIQFDPHTGKTAVDSLRVAGETTAGVHGANRLGGNSLAETIAIGQLVGENLADQNPTGPEEIPQSVFDGAAASLSYQRRFSNPQSQTGHSETADEQLTDLITELRQTLDSLVAIQRNEEELTEAANTITQILTALEGVTVNTLGSQKWEKAMNLSHMCLAAKMITMAARERRESRGAHYRSDYPEKDQDWNENICIQYDEGTLQLNTNPVPEMSDELKTVLAEGHSLSYHHLE